MFLPYSLLCLTYQKGIIAGRRGGEMQQKMVKIHWPELRGSQTFFTRVIKLPAAYMMCNVEVFRFRHVRPGDLSTAHSPAT